MEKMFAACTREGYKTAKGFHLPHKNYCPGSNRFLTQDCLDFPAPPANSNCRLPCVQNDIFPACRGLWELREYMRAKVQQGAQDTKFLRHKKVRVPIEA